MELGCKSSALKTRPRSESSLRSWPLKANKSRNAYRNMRLRRHSWLRDFTSLSLLAQGTRMSGRGCAVSLQNQFGFSKRWSTRRTPRRKRKKSRRENWPKCKKNWLEGKTKFRESSLRKRQQRQKLSMRKDYSNKKWQKSQLLPNIRERNRNLVFSDCMIFYKLHL
jgi:hypothetical protein